MRLVLRGRSDILEAMGIDPEDFGRYDIDHIIPKSLAGQNHPANYVVMLRCANQHFGWCISSKKLWYVGWDAMQGAAKHYRKVHSSLIGQRSCRLP
jgi:hypothetical protein